MEFVRGTTFFPSNGKKQRSAAGSNMDNGSSPSPVTESIPFPGDAQGRPSMVPA